MPSKVYDSFDAAVADVPDGASVMSAGFAGPGTPRNLLAALVRHGAKRLTLIANTAGRWGDDRMDVSDVIRAGLVAKVIASFTTSPHPSIKLAFDEMREKGLIEGELVPQGTLAERIRAGGAGIPAFYTPTGAETELAEGKEVRTFDGRAHVLETALRADYAIIRAHRADELGNLQFRYTQRNYGPIMARAARVTIVEVDNPIEEAGAIEPDFVHVPGIFVDRMVVVGPDGIPELPPKR
ncbi:MAG: 3-oxoacid CoA-transferase subunit A [Chloroflexota bacterium]